MQPSEFTISTWSPWIDKDTGNPATDLHGNFKGSVTFEEDKSEPIDATFKTQPAVGDKKYGTVDLYQTRAGKTRKGFKSAPRPNPAYGAIQGASSGDMAPKREWQPDSPEKQDSIARSVALKAAVDFCRGSKYEDVLPLAENFLAWLKGSSATSQQPQASGYEHARQQAQQIRERLPEPSVMPFEGSEWPIEDVPEEYRG